jgi:hypothetical protein
MTTALIKGEDIKWPEELREELDLSPEDEFEVSIEDDDTITLRRIGVPKYATLADWLLACPGPLEIPPLDEEDKPTLEF